LLECPAHVALAGATALAWLGLGSLVLAPLGSSGDRALDALNAFGAGAVAFALLTLGAGWLGLLYPAAYVPVFLAAALVGAVRLRGVRPSLPRGWPRADVALLALLAVYALLALVVTCAPVSSADALYYHAAAPELFEQEHRIVELPWSWHSYQPYSVEMLVLDGFLLWDSVQGAFAALLLGLGGLLAVVGAGTRLGGRRVGLLAGAVFFAQPLMLWLATSTFVEPGLAFAVALAGWNLVRYGQTGRVESLALAGLFAGAAAGMKYVGAAGAVVLVAGAVVWFRRRLARRHLLALALPALAVAVPWYVKNAILTGNPVYPFLFGGANEEAVRAARASFEEYGHGRSPSDLVLLPYRLLADADEFDRGEFASPLFLLFAPLALLLPTARRAAALVLAASVVYLLAWFAGSQQYRFLAPLMPALAILATFGIRALAERGRLERLVAVALPTAALATGLAVSIGYAAQFVPVAAGAESERRFLTENSSYYEGVDWLNRNLSPDARVLLGFVFALHVDRPTVVWTADVLPSSAGPAETRAFVRRFGLTHAAVLGTAMPAQLSSVGARPIARVTVHPIVSRTLSETGPPETMVVYALTSP
jgi:4-amino-4-deoxy-L-arabinose transferase-like glycosyltransferase